MPSDAHYWWMAVTRGGCVMCEAFPVTDPLILASHGPDLGRLEGHHLLPKSHLKKMGLELFDERNGVGACSYHHQRHTNYVQRIPRRLLPAGVHDFAAENGIQWLLDLEYPR